MTLWHYLLTFLIGSIVTWIGAARCARRGSWGWATAALAPIGLAAVWFGGLWTQMNWEAPFWDQEWWILIGEFALSATLWIIAAATWAAAGRAQRSSRRSRHGATGRAEQK